MTGNQREKVWKSGFLQKHRGFVYPVAGVAWLAIEKLALVDKDSVTAADGQWQKFKSPYEGPRLTVMVASWPSSGGDMCSTLLQGSKSGPQRTAGPCGVRLVCAQAAKGETMRLFLPLCGATISTLRALMDWLLWEPKAADPIPRSVRLPTADGYSSWFPAGPDRPCTHQYLQNQSRGTSTPGRCRIPWNDEMGGRHGRTLGTARAHGAPSSVWS